VNCGIGTLELELYNCNCNWNWNWQGDNFGTNISEFLIDSVGENKQGYTKQQLYHTLGCPTVENFKHILRQNVIKNCPITIDDVTNAEKIFGPDIVQCKENLHEKYLFL
jgi:hypothetical protein